MLLHIYAIRDTKVRIFHAPFFQRSVVEAVRMFTQAVNDPQAFISKYPTDYDLFELGSFEDQEGKFETHEPVFVVAGTTVKQEDRQG